ncbi:hypothetical protein DXG01_003467 [Tephrocybe rancida]|nr:hypothetical protein DXG01_003467 [Tephrocybe rancida]
MPLPMKRQSAIPSLGFARSQFIFVVETGSLAGARKPLPAQVQVFPESQAVPMTASPPNAHVDEHDHVIAGCSGSAESDPRTPKSKDHLAIDDTPAYCTIYCLSAEL